MELRYILFVVTTIAMFAHGYSVRKRHMPGVLISTLVAQVQLLINIADTGVYKFGQMISDTSVQDWTIGIVYTMFIWGVGYVLGGINKKRRDNADELPGKDVECEKCR